jgi:hypothetical protein
MKKPNALELIAGGSLLLASAIANANTIVSGTVKILTGILYLMLKLLCKTE